MQLDKRIQEKIGKHDLVRWNVGSSEKDVLYIAHVGKDWLEMNLFGNLECMKNSSLTFFIQYGVWVGTLGNEKDKEGKNLGGKGMRPNLSCPSLSLSFSLLLFMVNWSCFTSFNFVGCLFGQLAAICSKLKHLKHLVFKVLVDDLGVEGF